MKKILGLVFAILLVAGIVYAKCTGYYCGAASSGGSSFCTTCSGNLTFCWEITANDLTITNSGGCSAGDTTGTAASQATLSAAPSGRTGYAVEVGATDAGGYDNIAFDTASIFNDESGTIQLDFYIPSDGGFVAGTRLFGCEPQASQDRVEVVLAGTDEIRLLHEGANGGDDYVTTTSANIATDTWYTVIAKWRTGETTPYLSISCNGDTQTYTSSQLTAFDTAESILGFGNLGSGINGYAFIKNIKLWNAWQD